MLGPMRPATSPTPVWTGRRRARLRRTMLGSLVVSVCATGAMAALPHLTKELPKPLSDVARLPERMWTRAFPPRVSRKDRLAGLTAPEREAVAALAHRLAGLIV